MLEPYALTMASTSIADLAKRLAEAGTTTIYVDTDLDNVSDTELLAADPPLHVERDLVRGQWAVRLATNDEVAEAEQAQAKPAAPAAAQDKPAPAAAPAARTTSKT